MVYVKASACSSDVSCFYMKYNHRASLCNAYAFLFGEYNTDDDDDDDDACGAAEQVDLIYCT